MFDEAHMWSGAQGGEAVYLVRRLHAFCGKRPDEVTCVATSATIADPAHGDDARRTSAARFFGVDPHRVTLVGERYADDAWSDAREVTSPRGQGAARSALQRVLEVIRGVEHEDPADPRSGRFYCLTKPVTHPRFSPAFVGGH